MASSEERLLEEGLITLAETRRLLPRGVSLPTLHRWIHHGTLAKGGAVVRLEACRVGRNWYTSRPAVLRFVQAMTRGAAPAPSRGNSAETERKLGTIFGQVA